VAMKCRREERWASAELLMDRCSGQSGTGRTSKGREPR
jgi:hypothetical protein